MSAVIETAAAEGVRARLSRVLPATLVSARARDWVLAGAVFAVSFAVYNLTLAPGLTYASLDGNELATVPHQLGLLHSPGYPFYTWLGKLFTLVPVGDVAYRMNLMSATGAAGACALLYAIVVLLARNRPIALFAALLFSFSPALWSQAVITEVYAANAFMFALTVFLFLRWGERLRRGMGSGGRDTAARLLFCGGCLVFGLSLGTHLSNLALAPALAVYVFLLRRLRPLDPRTLLAGAGLFALAACQFVWLPLRADTLNDELMLRYKPDDPGSIYAYVFNVFSEDRFAFPLSALPDRLSTYAGLVSENFGIVGCGLALAGAWEMLRRQRKAFCFLGIAYLVEIAYFTQYNVPDIAVFFIPAHLLFAVFVAFGVRRLFTATAGVVPRRSATRAVLSLSFCALFAVPLTLQVSGGWSQNDRSGDTTVKDFYQEVIRAVPENSVLLGRPGVPGFDLFHHYLTSNPRPSVDIPQLEAPDAFTAAALDGRPLYLVAAPEVIRHSTKGLEGQALLPQDLWYVPVLAAPSRHVSWLGGRPLTLYRAQTEPPPFVLGEAHPQHAVGVEMDGVRFLGFDIDRERVAAGGTLHLRLYWQAVKPPALSFYKVSLVLGDARFRETHTLGFGLIERVQREGRFSAGFTFVEDYRLVVASGLSEGKHTLRLLTCDFGTMGSREEASVDLIEIDVVRP
ncbi:MAG: DUF2723 domain-containing protein [Dehalococcoidia bacterium]|nr:DUF2723 domain-containing protein [Dehalococcoidia bacterium]